MDKAVANGQKERKKERKKERERGS